MPPTTSNRSDASDQAGPAALAPGPPARVFVLDDHELIRRGLADLIEAEPDLEVVGEAGTAAAALARLPAVRPDVAVLDVRLPDGNGIEVCREIRSRIPEMHGLILTQFADERAVFDAVMAGASGYLLKEAGGAEILSGIRRVARGESLLDTVLTERVLGWFRGEASPLAQLRERERSVLALIGEGLTNRQIAQRLFLSEKTVRNYVSSLLAKLGVEHRTQAALYVARLGSAGANV